MTITLGNLIDSLTADTYTATVRFDCYPDHTGLSFVPVGPEGSLGIEAVSVDGLANGYVTASQLRDEAKSIIGFEAWSPDGIVIPDRETPIYLVRVPGLIAQDHFLLVEDDQHEFRTQLIEIESVTADGLFRTMG